MRPQCSVLYEYVSKERSGLFVLSLCWSSSGNKERADEKSVLGKKFILLES